MMKDGIMSGQKEQLTPKKLTLVERLSDVQISRAMHRIVFTATHLHESERYYLSTIYRIPFDLEIRERDKIRTMTQRGMRDYHPRFAPNGELTFISTRDKDIPQVFLIHSDGGEAQQMTNFLTGVKTFEWVPDAKHLIVESDVYPDLKTQEENFERDESRRLNRTAGYDLKGYPIRSFNRYMGPKYPHLFLFNTETKDIKDLTVGAEKDYIDRKWNISTDGKKIVVSYNIMGKDLNVYANIGIIDIETGERTPLTEEKNLYYNPKFSPDGSKVLAEYRPIEKGKVGKRDIVIIDVETKEIKNLTKDIDIWAFDPIWIPYMDKIIFHTEIKGTTQIWLYDGKTEKMIPLVEEGHSYGTKISPDGRNIIYIHERVNQPGDIYIKSTMHPEKPHNRITDFNRELLESTDLRPLEFNETEGANGDKVQYQLLKPVDFDPKKKYPMFLSIHGGPYVSFRDRFCYRFNPQLFVSRGYVVLRVNGRGSTGFGQKFIEENKGRWGDLGYKDIMAVVDKVSKEPFIDENKIGAMGQSFGGYMVNWIASQPEASKKFKCFVSFAGVYNLWSFYGTTDLSHKYEHEFDGSPFDNPQPYRDWSPSTYAKNMNKPMLLVHGGKDYRVSYSESLQLYTALSRHNVECEMLFFGDEDHWVAKPKNYIMFYEKVLDWFDKHL